MWWTSLFSSDKIVNKAVDLVDDSVRGVGNWIDEQQYTDEEKAVAYKKLMDFRLRVLEKTADESSVRSISRRILAWSITWFFLGVLSLYILGAVISAAWASKVLAVAKLMHSPFLAVVSFYFVAHLGNGWIERAKKKDD